MGNERTLYATVDDACSWSLGLAKWLGIYLALLWTSTGAWAASEPFDVKTPTGTLRGTLEVPTASQPWPVALIVAGSGPTDRDGNSPLVPGANNSLKLLAEGLAEHGIASVRYDKRGVAQSREAMGDESTMRFSTGVDDARAFLAQLRHDSRCSRVFIIGHSEGSQVGALAAAPANADAFVSLEGAGRPVGEILRDQMKSGGASPEALARVDSIVAQLKAGHPVEVKEPELRALFRASVQPYLMSWLPLDPAEAVGALKIPVLIVSGSRDLQVASSDADRLTKASARCRRLNVEGMNHVLKLAPADRAQNIAAYTDPKLPLARGLIEGVVAFFQSCL